MGQLAEQAHAGLFKLEDVRHVHIAATGALGQRAQRKVQPLCLGLRGEHGDDVHRPLAALVGLLNQLLVLGDEALLIEVGAVQIGLAEVEEHLVGVQLVHALVQQIEGVLQGGLLHAAVAHGDVQAEVLHQLRHR